MKKLIAILVSAVLLRASLLIPNHIISGILAMFWLHMIFFNIVLAVFNLLPIPPLDGSKILLGWSENPTVNKFLNSERYGLSAIIFIVFIIPVILQHFNINFNPIADYLRYTSLTIADWLI